MEQRALFARIKRLWQGLSAEQKAAWETAADGYKRTNRLGMSRTLSGSALHFKINAQLRDFTTTILDEPPQMKPTPAPLYIEWTFNLPNQCFIFYYCPLPQFSFSVQISTARPIIDHDVRPVKHWRRTITSAGPGFALGFLPEFTTQWGVPTAGECLNMKMRTWYLYDLPSDWVEASTVVLP
jgi:hypothetical protein